MKQYLNLVREIFDNGSWQDNRTGIRTLSIPGAMLKFDLQEGFPAVTTKKLAFKSAIGELVGFMRGYRNAADFRALGCKVWDQNANENAQWLASPFRLQEGDLGPVYGVQWRQWPAYKVIDLSQPKSAAQIEDALARGYRQIGTVEEVGENGKTTSALLYKAIDQLRQCLDTIIKDPGSRRILFHGWNWAQLEEMALPPCHLLYQFLVSQSKREISLCLYIRSNDVGLGTPFNLTEAAALLHLVGRLTGYTPRWLTYFIGDAHIYENHVDMLQEQLTREPFSAPKLVLSDRIPDYAVTGKYEPEWLEKVEPSDFSLEGYQHHAPLTAPMAV
ncbi:thymidylate synthase [Ralstonia pseudosolanacearum]|uniref:thymidylate synthase n=1 Tax=Ralstonia pseudosolanacearum TaxID=1310165 RepID=UPI002676BFA6|nr:thymidylate synthase [Ralstonia pseudosolanacearum]MDO3623582.1 thymidylate synthase [Ralstonia pseudosolanacearum]